MADQTIGTREEWKSARDALARLEAEQAARNEEITKKRLELPWVAVETTYEFETEEGKKTLAELFDGRSQLLAYNVMYGRTTRWAPAPVAPVWPTGSTARSSISTIAA